MIMRVHLKCGRDITIYQVFDKKKVDLKTVQTNAGRMQHLHFVKYTFL